MSNRKVLLYIKEYILMLFHTTAKAYKSYMWNIFIMYIKIPKNIVFIQNSPQGATELVVVHVGLGLPLAPSAGDLVGIGELELAIGALPGDAAGVVGVREQLEQELPQLDLARAWKGKRVI